MLSIFFNCKKKKKKKKAIYCMKECSFFSSETLENEFSIDTKIIHLVPRDLQNLPDFFISCAILR